MQIKNGTFCPLIKKDCIGLECSWFTRIQGYDTNTGKQVDEYQCAISLMPMLLVENSGQQRSTGAAVESFRNEMVKANQTSQQILLHTAQANARLVEPNNNDSIIAIQNKE
jgi:hypothetical protein